MFCPIIFAFALVPLRLQKINKLDPEIHVQQKIMQLENERQRGAIASKKLNLQRPLTGFSSGRTRSCGQSIIEEDKDEASIVIRRKCRANKKRSDDEQVFCSCSRNSTCTTRRGRYLCFDIKGKTVELEE